MKRNRLIGMLLALVTVLGVATGCGGKSSNVEDLPTETVTLTVGIPQNSNVSDYKDNAFTKYLEETANVKLKFSFFSSTPSEYKQQLALMCSANEKLPDVLLGFSFDQYQTNQYGEDGFFIDLTDYIEAYAPNYRAQLENLDEETRDYILNKGKHMETGAYYGMPRVLCRAWDDLQSDMFINQNWLTKLDLQMPTTTEELKAVLKAFVTKDPNGNGINDEIALLGSTDLINYLLNAFVSYREGAFNVTDGKVWDPVKTDEFRQGVIYANELVSEGLYDKLSFTVTKPAELRTLISPTDGPSKVGIFVGAPERVTNPATDALDEFAALPVLEDATGKGGYTIIDDPVMDWCAFITKDCKYPAAAMKLIDTFYMDETITRQRHGEKDVDWVYEEGTNVNGTAAYTKPVNTEAFFSGSSTWCLNACGIMTQWNYLTIMTGEGTNRQAQVNRLAGEQWAIMQSGKLPAENAIQLQYTNEEYAVREAKASKVNQYITEQTILFVAGERDPKDDAAWNDFLSTIDTMGRSELMEICQQAYDRK